MQSGVQKFSCMPEQVAFLQELVVGNLWSVDKMDKIEQRAVIKFLTLEGIAAKEIHERMAKVYKDNGPSYDVVKDWAILSPFWAIRPFCRLTRGCLLPAPQ